jgi:hypothetical protein
LPPRSFVKKCIPRYRSAARSKVATVSGGIAKIIRMAVQSEVHVKSGRRIHFMPGDRNL